MNMHACTSFWREIQGQCFYHVYPIRPAADMSSKSTRDHLQQRLSHNRDDITICGSWRNASDASTLWMTSLRTRLNWSWKPASGDWQEAKRLIPWSNDPMTSRQRQKANQLLWQQTKTSTLVSSPTLLAIPWSSLSSMQYCFCRIEGPNAFVQESSAIKSVGKLKKGICFPFWRTSNRPGFSLQI